MCACVRVCVTSAVIEFGPKVDTAVAAASAETLAKLVEQTKLCEQTLSQHLVREPLPVVPCQALSQHSVREPLPVYTVALNALVRLAQVAGFLYEAEVTGACCCSACAQGWFQECGLATVQVHHPCPTSSHNCFFCPINMLCPNNESSLF